jgi:Mor family transcriptional regulator
MKKQTRMQKLILLELRNKKIKEMRADGMSMPEIGRRYAISKQRVEQILKVE